MTARVHIHLHVADLAKSREFYRKFFGVMPVKEKVGYVKFLPELAPITLALSEGRPVTSGGGPVNHVGIQVDSTQAVLAHLARVKATGLPVREEMGVSCCHANQDKFWVHDPDGVAWEIYHLNYDLEDEGTAASAEHAAPAVRAAGLPTPQAAPCCAPGSRRR